METSKCRIIGAITLPIAAPKDKKTPIGANKPIKVYQKPLKTKLGPILFNAYKNKKTK